jgi:phosphoribosyl 1,2-cyclic phosphodiesterase
MRARIWGCRGSLATPGAATVGYGGNTTSVELRTGAGGLIVLDAGTGIRKLGLALEPDHPRSVHLLLTHMHLDHVEGLGFFAPLFVPGCTVTIWGPRPDETSLREHLRAYLSPPLFPVPFDRFPATVDIVEVGDETWEMDGVTITAGRVTHPGPTLGYRIAENGNSFAFIPDNEPGIDAEPGLALAAGVDVLVHDAQYTAEEYATRVGWGHASLPDFATFVRAADPGATVMFHHDPSHDDRALEGMELEARALAERETITLAREGAVIDVKRIV